MAALLSIFLLLHGRESLRSAVIVCQEDVPMNLHACFKCDYSSCNSIDMMLCGAIIHG